MYRNGGLVLVAVLAVLLLAPASSPVQLSYVVSDSMEPALHPGDGYVLVPPGDVEPGDVITFRAPTSDRPITHRVVAVTSEGLVTKGDANRVTDQAVGRSHVDRWQIVGEVLTVGGTVVRLPGLGTIVGAVEEYSLAIVGLLLASLLVHELRRDDQSTPGRPVQAGDVVRPLLAGLLVFAVAMVFVAATSQPVTYVATTLESDHPQRLTVGEPATTPILLEGEQPPFTHRIVSADGMRVTDVSENGSQLQLTVVHPPPERYGVLQKSIRVYHYPVTVPESVLRRLHGVHPLLAAVVSVGITLAPVVVLVVGLIDGGEPLRLPRSRTLRELIR